MALKLVATSGTQVLALQPGRPLMVGRSSLCDLPVDDPTVSRRHASVEVSAGLLRVRDLGSLNGTFVNGTRIADEVARPGDGVSFGRAAFELREERPEPAWRADAPEAALDATILRQVPVTGRADIAARVSGKPQGTSRLRIGGASSEERSGKRLALMLDIAKELSGQADVDRLLQKVADLSFQVMDVDRVAVLLVEEETGELAARVLRSRSGGSDPVRVPRAIAQKVLSERVAVLIENAPADVRFDRRRAAGEPIQSALCAPLLGTQGAALGLIYLDNLKATHSFTDEDLDFLTSFSGITAVAIENSQLMADLQRKAVTLSNFQRYFAPELAEQIAAEPGEVGLGGAKRRVVVLFADIRGFTALSEKLSPDEIASQLNEYFSEMVEIVFEHDGTLDKFIGDALMAIWGAPLARPDDADRAARAAVAMQRAVERLNRVWQRQGRHRLEVGIGINQGEVFAGNIGSSRRLEYTVIGDAVNTAALLCSRAGPGEILIAEPLCRALETVPDVTPLASLPLKGKAREVPIYRVEWSPVAEWVEGGPPTLA